MYIAQVMHKMQHKVLNTKANNYNIHDKTIKRTQIK